MYLSMRVNNVDIIDIETGRNVFFHYMLKQDLERMQQLIMRGADINFVNEINGYTPLHRAIEDNLDSKVIKFLIKQGAYLHSEDKNGFDCCDKVRAAGTYNNVKEFNRLDCIRNPKLR